MTELLKANQSVVRVGVGRGFVVEGRDGDKYVVTASHCLRDRHGKVKLPPAHPFSNPEGRTYPALVGSLGRTKPRIWVKCLFVDPVSGIAVLGKPEPDFFSSRAKDDAVFGKVLFDEAEAYEEFIKRPALDFRPVQDGEDAWLLALDEKHWFRCRVRCGKASSYVTDAAEGIRSGMSGSPILGRDGKVISVCCIDAASNIGGMEDLRESGPNPVMANLPVWFLEEMVYKPSKPRSVKNSSRTHRDTKRFVFR